MIVSHRFFVPTGGERRPERELRLFPRNGAHECRLQFLSPPMPVAVCAYGADEGQRWTCSLLYVFAGQSTAYGP